MAVGYCTLYGDMAGGFAVLKDISKTLVYRLCHYRNSLGRVIPERIITRPPSAELRPDQIDQDSLPPYDILDAILAGYMEQDRAPSGDRRAGLSRRGRTEGRSADQDERIQAPPGAVGIRITPRGFGKDWRYPITSAWNEWESVGGPPRIRA